MADKLKDVIEEMSDAIKDVAGAVVSITHAIKHMQSQLASLNQGMHEIRREVASLSPINQPSFNPSWTNGSPSEAPHWNSLSDKIQMSKLVENHARIQAQLEAMKHMTLDDKELYYKGQKI